MISPAMADTVLPAIVAICILLMLIRPKNIPEVYWISGGAALLVTLRLIPLKLAGKAIAEGSDVYLFLIGMMLLSELARENGVFDWLTSVAVRTANGSCSRLFTLAYGIGTVVTIFMSNDATAVVLTPAILTAVRKAKIEPLPYLFVCALIANAASFVLPISNPANLVVFHQGMPPLGQWLLSCGVPSLLSIATTYGVMRLVFRKDLGKCIECEVDAEPLRSEGKLVLAGLVLMIAVLLTASEVKKDLGLPACLAALAITAVVSIKNKSNPLKLAKEISWGTLVLVAGLFVMVDAVESIGILKHTQGWLADAQKLAPAAGAMVVGFGVGLANNLVNNLPLGLIAGGTLHAAHVKGLLANAVLIGVDLGPNLSITGSLATVLWMLALRREKLDVSFWQFLKVGAIVMPVALAVSLGGAVVMQVLFPTHQSRNTIGEHHERWLDYFFHRPRWRTATMWCRHERPTEQIDRQSLAHFNDLISADDVLFRRSVPHHAASVAYDQEPCRNAVVGCGRRARWSCPGVCRPDFCEQDRCRTLYGVHRYRSSYSVPGDRPLRLVPDGSAPISIYGAVSVACSL